jgi:hypothetical protein
MSGSAPAFYGRLMVLLGYRRCSNAQRGRWQTRHAVNLDEAIRKVKELYPNAVHGPWQTDGTGWLPTGEVMCVWQNQEAFDRKEPPVAAIRRYTP